jgi:tetratricopeptide (TPR) repeat protein
MKLRLAGLMLLATLGPMTAVVRAEQPPPRDIWPQATSAANAGDLDAAIKQTSALMETGRSYGLKTFPQYAASAAALARQADKENNKPVSQWAAKAAEQLDPTSSAVAFSNADRAADQRQWGKAIPYVLTGYARVFGSYRTRLLSRADSMMVLLLAIALTSAIFAVSLFFRYFRAMAHDFRENLSRRFRGGSVTVLAFALLFLPVFFWLGPVWLVFYWFIIFFGYARPAERVLIIVLSLLLALTPIALDLASHWIAGSDNPAVVAAVGSTEQSYQPDALRRMQDLVSIIPNNARLQLLLGNLLMYEGNDRQAADHYRQSASLKDSAGAHVNLGNLHYLDNDFAAAVTEYEKAEALDPRLAITFYNHSLASGETYKFDEQAKMLETARRLDRATVDRLSSNPPAQKVVMYHLPIGEAWDIARDVARSGAARSLFGNYSHFDVATSAVNPLTLGALGTIALALFTWLRRRRAGYAGSCIKCGRTFCHRCKSARESATYCTQCIHIYLKRDGVSLDTKRTKLEEVQEHHGGMLRRNRIFATLMPGTGQLLEGRTIAGIIGLFVFLVFVCLALLVGRLAPVLAAGEVATLLVRVAAIVIAVITWLVFALPVWRRRASTV